MAFLIYFGVVILYARIHSWARDRPQSGFRSGVFSLFKEVLSIAFLFWLFAGLPWLMRFFPFP
jgi:hypothetical protein